MAEERKIRLELTPDAMDGIYTNFSVLTHTSGEFVIDFARIVPGKPVAKVYSRIIMSPINFKLFKQAVDQNLANYELKNGRINTEGFDAPSPLNNGNQEEITAQSSDVIKRKEEFKKLFGIDEKGSDEN
jgi:hypothetical protein